MFFYRASYMPDMREHALEDKKSNESAKYKLDINRDIIADYAWVTQGEMRGKIGIASPKIFEAVEPGLYAPVGTHSI